MTTHTTAEQHTTDTPTAPAPAALTGAHAQIRQALNDQPGATAAMLAQTTRISRPTAAKALAAMEKDGLARREPGTPDGNRRVASHWYPNQPTQPDTNSPTNEEVATSAPEAAEEDEAARPEPPTTTSTDEENSPHEDHAEPATPPIDDAEAPEADEAATDGSPHHETEAAPNEPVPPTLTVITGGGKQRLAPGTLRQMVLNHLQTHPDAEFTATALSRVLGKSSGAIANALVTLEKNGQARQVNDHPRKYQLHADIEQ
ncbi:helix-turn-helix domain-containing protein [Streptomyces sp. NPDC020096]